VVSTTGPSGGTAREEELLAFLIREPGSDGRLAATAGPVTFTTHLRAELFTALGRQGRRHARLLRHRAGRRPPPAARPAPAVTPAPGEWLLLPPPLAPGRGSPAPRLL